MEEGHRVHCFQLRVESNLDYSRAGFFPFNVSRFSAAAGVSEPFEFEHVLLVLQGATSRGRRVVDADHPVRTLVVVIQAHIGVNQRSGRCFAGSTVILNKGVPKHLSELRLIACAQAIRSV